MATVQRRLSVIVCADVVGYSRLMGSDELGTLTALKAHREAIDPLFAEEGGRLVKTTGDGLLLEFPSAFHAVRASLNVQRLMAERNTAVPEDKRLVFRMGVHLGDVIVDDGDIFGDGVNIAARLQEIADPGGICLSQAVHATIHKNIDALFRDGGNKVLKNIAAPVHVYNLALDNSTSAVPMPATPPSVPLLSLIVLPFVNLSGDSRQDYLVDSVTDHLTTELARIDSSFVVARNTALSYRGDALDVTEIGRELGVHYAIKGSVRAQPGGLRINTQLIDTGTGQHLWIDRFDIAIGDAFAMQRDVVVRLIPPLHAHLLAASGRAPQPAPAVLPQTGDGAPARGVTMAHPHGGTVVYPRGVTPALNARAAAAAARPANSPPRSEPRPAPPVVRATSSPEVPSTSPAPRMAHQPAPFRIPFWVKILVIAIVGGVALAMLGAERRSVVEIVSWMLIAAGSVQMISAFTASPRRG
jgi:class 3 adenylate cyclase/TolB-like protein